MPGSAAGLLALLALASQLAVASEEVETALVADEECAGADSEAQCALNALQRRSPKAAESPADGAPTLTLEMFRAMQKRDLEYDFANIDMGTVGGVMNYLHTDVVGEHTGDYNGYQPKVGLSHRINGVDTIVGITTHVKNPDSVVKAVGNFVDFALSAHFIDGEATGPAYNWNFGDIVGAQKGNDPRWPLDDPYYKFSLSGFCPNLKWDAKKKGAVAAIKAHKHDEDGEAPATETGRRRRRQPGMCMTYSNQFHQPFGEVLRGGLCPNGTSAGVMPTGKSGCVYTYQPPTADRIVSLDALVGITKQECQGGRLCKNWGDWRRHCTNKKYQRKFNYKSRRRYSTILRSKACVEYDIHKACAQSCTSKACLKVPSDKRELGLPFWKGRCSAHMNAMRSERLAEALGVSSGKTHQLQKTQINATCLSPSSTHCHPNPKTGGMYCSRVWGGVCQACYVPGTLEAYELAEDTPMCPWSIFQTSSDYKGKLLPECSSQKPSDLCCLYTSTCNATYTSDPPITEDGFAYVSSTQDNEAMVGYLQQAARVGLGVEVADTKKLAKIAYWQWGLAPIKGKTLKDVMAMVRHLS